MVTDYDYLRPSVRVQLVVIVTDYNYLRPSVSVQLVTVIVDFMILGVQLVVIVKRFYESTRSLARVQLVVTAIDCGFSEVIC